MLLGATGAIDVVGYGNGERCVVLTITLPR